MIDPIDGTRHFVKNIPLWAVLISLIVDGEPVVGVSYMPCLNEIMYAEKGQGTFINGHKVSVSKFSRLDESILLFCSLRFFKEKMRAVLEFVNECASTRSYVSAYEFHLLVSGRSEVILDAHRRMWDAALYKVIVEEAGGKYTNWNGEPWEIGDIGCVASNKILHNKVMEVINKSA
jgi:histidinol-phosphatase